MIRFIYSGVFRYIGPCVGNPFFFERGPARHTGCTIGINPDREDRPRFVFVPGIRVGPVLRIEFRFWVIAVRVRCNYPPRLKNPGQLQRGIV